MEGNSGKERGLETERGGKGGEIWYKHGIEKEGKLLEGMKTEGTLLKMNVNGEGGM